MKDFHVYFGNAGRSPDYQVIRKIRDIIPVLKQSPNPKNIIIVAPVFALPIDLQKDVTIVDFNLPSFEEIKNLSPNLTQKLRHHTCFCDSYRNSGLACEGVKGVLYVTHRLSFVIS